MATHFEKTRKYLKAIEDFALDAQGMEGVLHPEFVQIELPNALNKNGQRSSRDECFTRMKTAKAILSAQKFDLTNHCESGDKLFVECVWTGTMAMDAGPLKKGQALKASFCMAFDFKDGMLHRQRNYDCFEPFV